MKIIIAGAGKIGYSVASILSDEGHDIIVIDNNPAVINNLSNNLDVICVEGSAANPETLTEAGAADADLIMAAMRSDEMNMVCGISARSRGLHACLRDGLRLRRRGAHAVRAGIGQGCDAQLPRRGAQCHAHAGRRHGTGHLPDRADEHSLYR